jgi:hypothetical protein
VLVPALTFVLLLVLVPVLALLPLAKDINHLGDEVKVERALLVQKLSSQWFVLLAHLGGSTMQASKDARGRYVCLFYFLETKLAFQTK